jgi:sulfoxide reductase catalytic subunit YedY
MLIKRRRGWEIAEGLATPESVVLSRRSLAGLAGAAVAGAGLIGAASPAHAQWSRLLGGSPAVPAKPLKVLVAARNDKYDGKRAITGETEATTYNNYYEFGMSKSIHAAAQALPVEPWTIEIAGMVAKPRKIGFDELMKAVSLEERVYRMRCVEAWAMTVPWLGFQLSDLVKLAEPQAGAKYVVFQTLADTKIMPGLKQSFYPWPYTDGCTMAEAANELAFLAVGMFGKSAPPQNGAPIRLVLPWKYGFKGVKSIVRVEFTDKRPVSFWESLQGGEYGFWANVNPAVPHARWSQARERLLGSDEMVPTQIWNGYGAYVADMYNDLKSERLFA